MSPPQLFVPEWFLRNIVSRRAMEALLDRVEGFYDDLYMEVVYRAHHGSYKVSYAETFYQDFVDHVAGACGLKKRVFWRHLPEVSALRHMHERRRRFHRILRRRGIFGDIGWSLEYWLSQLSFWHATVKAFALTWREVAVEGRTIPQTVTWSQAITLYIIADFTHAAKHSNYNAVKKAIAPKYREYIQRERQKLKILLQA